LSDAKSHKFWNIDVTGSSFTVTFGKIGTTGQTQTKEFATSEKAHAQAEKRIRQKTAKGYVETTPKLTVSDAEAFEEAIRADPDDLAAASAYADYLMEHNDPRGEFMQVQIALESKSVSEAERNELLEREQSLLGRHEREWLGALAAHLTDQAEYPPYERSNRVQYRFRRGWLAELNVPELNVEFTRSLIRCAESRFLRTLRIRSAGFLQDVDERVERGRADLTTAKVDSPPVRSPNDGLSPRGQEGMTFLEDPSGRPVDIVFKSLARYPYFSSLRAFHLGNAVSENYEELEPHLSNQVDGTHAYHLVKQMPNLEELCLVAPWVNTSRLFGLQLPRLRVLQVFRVEKILFGRLASNTSLGNLTQLLLQSNGLCHWDPTRALGIHELKSILYSSTLTKLIHLLFRGSEVGDRGVVEIVKSGILKRLEVLDLKDGTITDEGARVLAECPDARRLKRLNLEGNAPLTTDGVARLKAAGINVSATPRQT
jgi:uncharacterized protein (TIGR02996 family)